VHIAAFAFGTAFAWLAFRRDRRLLGHRFSLFGAAKLVYMTYHLDWTVFLFAEHDSLLALVTAGSAEAVDAGEPFRQQANQQRGG
jgi:hypothetical protein